MPLINGTCVPMACYTRSLIQANSRVFQIITRSNNPIPQQIDVTNNPAFAGLLNQGLNMLRPAADLKCDGCVCHGTRFNPPIRIPTSVLVQQNQDTDAAGVTTVYMYVVTADWDWRSLGNCYPPGSPIHVGNKWIPVETAPWNEYHGEKSGSGGGTKGKKRKTKAKAVRRVKKPLAKKAKATTIKARKASRRR